MNTTRNLSSISAKLIVWMFVLAAAALSAHDIVSLFERLEAPRPLSFLAPVFIDGITWLGKLMRSHKLSKRTNKLGLKYLVIGGGTSLAANLVAGETPGMKLLGLLAVVGFILGEIALDKIEPRVEEPAVDPAEVARQQAIADAAAQQAAIEAAEATRRSESAKLAAATRRENKAKAEKAAEDKREARRVRDAARRLAEAVPISANGPATEPLSAADQAVLVAHDFPIR